MKRNHFLKSLCFLPTLPMMSNLNELSNYADTLSLSPKMPVLFLGHGSPMNAIEENQFVKGFRETAKTIPKPKAILCISAHWYTKGTKVTAMEMPETIHDFGGFPKALFDVQYPAKGSPELARNVETLLQPNLVELDDKWGLDHGAWSVLKHLYPNAEVPVIQMSIDYSQPANYHFELAKKLAELRNKGILIIGSGNIIHNLGAIDFRNFDKDNYGFEWAHEAHQILNSYLINQNFEPLFDYKKLGKAVQLAIPTPDHYLPLMYVLGLKQKNEKLSLFNDKLVAGSISMTSVKIE